MKKAKNQIWTFIVTILLIARLGVQAQTVLVNEALIRQQISAILTTNSNKAITGATTRELLQLMVTYIKQADSLKTGAKAVATYAAMTALGTPTSPTYYKVAVDENKSANNTYYLWWPDGKRIRITATDDN